jgi:DNA polymerase-1
MPKRAQQSTLPGMECDQHPENSVHRAPPEPREGSSAPPSEPNPSPSAPPDIRDWSVYVVDAHSLIFQVFHAMYGSELSSPRGEPVSAVFGFTRDLLQIIERKKPTALVCAFDMSGPTFRHELYDAYKPGRGEMPADLQSQIPKIRQRLSALAIPVLESPAFEADDVLASLARICDEAGAK